MIEIHVPGWRRLALAELVADYNGTLAVDGVLRPGVPPLLRALAGRLRLHVLTADTFGVAREQLAGLPVALTVLPPARQDEAKRRYVDDLGAAGVVAIGNGRNDAPMLEAAGLGIAVVQEEGAALRALVSAELACRSVEDALGLLLNPRRLTATLRA